MKLYWHPFSIMPWRVRVALHEKGIAYESVEVDDEGWSPDLPGGSYELAIQARGFAGKMVLAKSPLQQRYKDT